MPQSPKGDLSAAVHLGIALPPRETLPQAPGRDVGLDSVETAS